MRAGQPSLEQCRQPISAGWFFGRGFHVRPKWAAHELAHMGLLWAQVWAAHIDWMFFGSGLHVRPKWAAHELAHMGLLWAQWGLPRLGSPGWNNVGSPYRLDVFLAAGSTSGPSRQPMN